MERKNRPTGRTKRVGSGRGSVSRRGSGLKKRTGGSVGTSGGYKPKTTSTRPSTQNFNTSGIRPKMSMKSMMVIGVILLVAWWFLNQGGNQSDLGISDLLDSSNDVQQVAQDTVEDQGAYRVDTSVIGSAKDKRTQIQGNGQDDVTLMIYMLGTDLESRSGMATADLNEITQGRIADNVKIVLQTGGTKKWQNSVISNKTNQRYLVTEEGLVPLETDLGKASMVKPDTLSDFIQYSHENYPADRYMLVLWDHGGGSLTGYGYDEYFPGDHMTLDEIDRALKDGGTTFDWIGFDACLMATVETALVLEPYADYMIASEELEPGIGWYYTEWITALSDNTSIATIDLGKKLIDDYVKEVAVKTPRSDATLSLTDLAELKATMPSAIKAFSDSANELLASDDYQTIANARAGSKEFAKSSKIDQIDLADFAKSIGTKEAMAMVEAIEGAVKYNRTSSGIRGAYGLSAYFPYKKLQGVGPMLDTYEEIDMVDEYAECVRSFASMAAGGQIVAGASGNSSNPLAALTGQSDVVGTLTGALVQQALGSALSGDGLGSLLGAGANWLNGNLMNQSTDYLAENQLDGASLKITEKNGQNVLSLSDDQWALIQQIEQNVFIDDGEGFIDLGLDNVYEWNDDGDLIMDYDGTWMAINDHVVSYYLISEERAGNRYTIRGRVPAMLNDVMVNIMIEFDENNPYGVVLGAQPDYDKEGLGTAQAKGLIVIEPGDRIDYLCDYYHYDGSYDDSFYLGEAYTATGEWFIENLDISHQKHQMTYRLTDIYNNQFWTPTVTAD